MSLEDDFALVRQAYLPGSPHYEASERLEAKNLSLRASLVTCEEDRRFVYNGKAAALAELARLRELVRRMMDGYEYADPDVVTFNWEEWYDDARQALQESEER